MLNIIKSSPSYLILEAKDETVDDGAGEEQHYAGLHNDRWDGPGGQGLVEPDCGEGAVEDDEGADVLGARLPDGKI